MTAKYLVTTWAQPNAKFGGFFESEVTEICMNVTDRDAALICVQHGVHKLCQETDR